MRLLLLPAGWLDGWMDVTFLCDRFDAAGKHAPRWRLEVLGLAVEVQVAVVEEQVEVQPEMGDQDQPLVPPPAAAGYQVMLGSLALAD